MIKKHSGFLVISLFIIITCFFNPCSVFAKDYEISNYDVEMQLNTEGDYLITERISYNFLEGSFSTAYREVSGRGFSGLEFISLESGEVEISDYEVKEGKNLEISWEYPSSSGEKTFIIRYKALGGLLSRDNQNVIDWNPVGDDWSVPVKDIDIRIFLPWDIDKMEVQPAEDLVYKNGRELHFHYEQLPPSTHYHLIISFPEKVETGRGEGFNFLLFFLLLIPGIILMVFDLTIGRRRVKALMPEEEITLSFTETSLVYFGGMQNRKGVSAAVFNLARRAKIKLLSRVSKAVFGSKKVEVEPVILSEDDLSGDEEIIIEGLKKNKTLKKFATEYGLFNKTHRRAFEALKDRGIISRDLLKRRKAIYFSALVYGLPAVLILIYGFMKQFPLVAGSGAALLSIAVGRVIKGAISDILSPEGMYLKDKITAELDSKKDQMEALIKEEKADQALEFFFNELDYIILHRGFNSYTLNKYKKVFKKAGEVEIPSWLELNLDDLDTTLEQLELIEVIDYLMLSTIVVASSTGASSTGAGAPGSGAGGGGGGAA